MGVGGPLPRPGPEELSAAWGRIIESAKAKFRGEDVDEDRQTRDHDTFVRWQRAEGVDLTVEAERAKQMLMVVGRAQE